MDDINEHLPVVGDLLDLPASCTKMREEFPHVYKKIEEVWGKPETLKLLNRLLTKNNFDDYLYPYYVVNELLMLQDVFVYQYDKILTEQPPPLPTKSELKETKSILITLKELFLKNKKGL